MLFDVGCVLAVVGRFAVVCCLVIVVRCVSFVDCRSLCVVRCLLLVVVVRVRCLSFVVCRYLLCVVDWCRLVFVFNYAVLVMWCVLLRVVVWLLLVACCL